MPYLELIGSWWHLSQMKVSRGVRDRKKWMIEHYQMTLHKGVLVTFDGIMTWLLQHFDNRAAIRYLGHIQKRAFSKFDMGIV